MLLLAIDPGNIESAYVLMDAEYKIKEFGKVSNQELQNVISKMPDGYSEPYEVAIEMIASYGMPVGKEVFDTCVWVGRFWEKAIGIGIDKVTLVYRKDVKVNLCNSAKAKDGNVIQALKDRFGDRGTKSNPGYFYGVKADVWQAYAVGVTYLDSLK